MLLVLLEELEANQTARRVRTVQVGVLCVAETIAELVDVLLNGCLQVHTGAAHIGEIEEVAVDVRIAQCTDGVLVLFVRLVVELSVRSMEEDRVK